jgi:DNA repair protein RecO (recombination protein O)
MTLKYRTKGFVFKKDDRGEADQSFSVFTKDYGRLDLKAKAIRKITSKLRADIDIFFFLEVEFIQGKNNKTLTDAAKIEKFDNVICDTQKLQVAYKISDILDRFVKGQEKDDTTFNLLRDSFDKLKGDTFSVNNHQLIFQCFFWNFVSLQGYRIEVRKCVACQLELNQHAIYFSNKVGGVLCKNCATISGDAKIINSDIVKILRLIFIKDWHTLSKLRIGQFSKNLLEDICQDAIHYFCPVHC